MEEVDLEPNQIFGVNTVRENYGTDHVRNTIAGVEVKMELKEYIDASLCRLQVLPKLPGFPLACIFLFELSFLQMTEIPVICKLGANTITETNISNLMKFTSGLTASSIDIAFLSRNKDIIGGIIEVRNVETGFRNAANRRNIEQLGAYMLSAQAFSQWGVGSRPRTEPIIGLLVYPTAIYRLSIMKPADGVK